MDILNFISWIRGGRKFTKVNPNTTLLPVGVRDNRRDDKYLAGGISVTDFANDLGIGIEIPKLIVKANAEDIQFSLDFYNSDAWKALNPKIFLYKMSKSKKVKTAGNYTRKRKGFVHPTNTAGIQPGGRWWTGEQLIQLGNTPVTNMTRHTEFPLTETLPYKTFTLPDLSMYEWLGHYGPTIRQCTALDFPASDDIIGQNTDPESFNYYIKPFGTSAIGLYDFPRAIRASNMKIKFRFAIVIDNPNATPDQPFLIGPMSENVVLRFAKSANGQYPNVPQGYVIPIFTPDHISSIASVIP
jgi:hypothetical protein